MPDVTGTASGTLSVTPETVTAGGVQHQPVTVPDGINDIMYGGFHDTLGSLSFRPGLSQDGLKVGLHLDWTVEEAQNVITFWAKHLAANAAGFLTPR